MCLQDCAAELAKALAVVPPFDVTLREFDCFPRGKDSTMFLRPDETVATEGWQTLYRMLAALYPECVAREKFVPHLTVGQFGNATAVKRSVAEYSSQWTPVSFTVGEVCLISRSDFHDPFHVRHRIKLGSQ